jgi:dTDP-glucose 4,6-dehydratase
MVVWVKQVCLPRPLLYMPSSPYSASKAAADLLALSYFHTFGLPVCVTRCSNNYGPYQFPEKLIPLFILNASQNNSLPVYGDGLNVRDWIHVDDHNQAVACVVDKGISGQVYNVGASNEWDNLSITHAILAHLGKPKSLIRFVDDRLGHDRRYAIDSTKIQQELGWSPKHLFPQALKDTIDWYLTNPQWINAIGQRHLQDNSAETNLDVALL